MQTLGMLCGIVAALFHLVAYALYGRANYKGSLPLNLATWTLWVGLTWLNAASYLDMSGDIGKSVGSIAGSLACTVVWLLAIVRRSTSKLDALDVVLFLAGVASAGAWWYWKNSTIANLILQGAITVSMIPTYRRLLRDDDAERPLPWLLWGSAYAFVLAAVLLRWTGHWPDLAYPIVNGITHSGVGFIALHRRKKSPAPS